MIIALVSHHISFYFFFVCFWFEKPSYCKFKHPSKWTLNRLITQGNQIIIFKFFMHLFDNIFIFKLTSNVPKTSTEFLTLSHIKLAIYAIFVGSAK